MSGPLNASLVSVLARLKGSLIVPGDDLDLFTDADHDRALGYRVLAAAVIEQGIEQICLQAARDGVERLRKNQPTRTGRSVLAWYCVRKNRPVPVHPDDFFIDPALYELSVRSFEDSVRATHGMSRESASKLLFPLGVLSDPLVDKLLDLLDELASARNKAAHIWVNRTRQLQAPMSEVRRVSEISDLLTHLTNVLDKCVTTY